MIKFFSDLICIPDKFTNILIFLGVRGVDSR